MKALKVILTLLFVNSIYWLNAQIDYKSFKGEKVNTSIELKLKNVFFKVYGNERFDSFEEFIVKNNNLSKDYPENLLHLLYSVDNKRDYSAIFKGKTPKITSKELQDRSLSDTLINQIRLIHRLTFDYNSHSLAFLKYKRFKDSISYSSELIALEKDLNTATWKIIVESEFPNTEYAIKRLKSSAFWQFFNRHNDDDYPKINVLKPMVQDSNGILDIEKLGEVIKKNKTQLSDYLD